MLHSGATNAPVPEPPRVVPQGPWVLDTSSITTSSIVNRPTTTIHPSEDLLNQLRKKYGIYVDEQDNNLPNVQLTSDPLSLNTIQQTQQHQLSERKNSEIQNQLRHIQANIRQELLKLSNGQKSNVNKCDRCLHVSQNSSLVTKKPTNEDGNVCEPKQLYNIIQQQDKQLRMIHEKIDQLLRIHQEKSDDEQTIDTTTGAVNNTQQNKQVAWHSMESSDSSQSYLDCSIEKVRKDLRKNVETRKIQPQTSMKVKSTQAKRVDWSLDDDEFYSSVLSQVNSILVRNGSFDSSNTTTSTSSPSPSQNYRKPVKTTSNPKPANSKHPRQLLRTEQSIYIERLASKYHLQDYDDEQRIPSTDNNDIVLESIRVTDYRQQQLRTKANVNIKHLNRYALSDHNTSIATRNYMDKYGLVMTTGNNENDNNQEKLIQEIKSRPLTNNNVKKLIDLDIIDSLPKFK